MKMEAGRNQEFSRFTYSLQLLSSIKLKTCVSWVTTRYIRSWVELDVCTTRLLLLGREGSRMQGR